MLKLFALLVVLALMAVRIEAVSHHVATFRPCSKAVKQAKVCPKIYRPECGLLKNGQHVNFPNNCVACHNPLVVSIKEGKC